MTYNLIIELKDGREHKYSSNKCIWGFGKDYIMIIEETKTPNTPKIIRYPLMHIEKCIEEAEKEK